MKAIRFHHYGGPEVLRLEDTPIPEIKADEVLIRVKAAGVNLLDVYQRTGLYKTPVPFGPGMEGAGVIEKVGSRARCIQEPGWHGRSTPAPMPSSPQCLNGKWQFFLTKSTTAPVLPLFFRE